MSFNPQLEQPKHEIITIGAHLSDEDAERIVKSAIGKVSGGRHGKKVLLRIEDPVE
jgi:mitochondrial enoyl-[acyl-carrier protein] reductase / trans-2-enoyl-CoA reductase